MVTGALAASARATAAAFGLSGLNVVEVGATLFGLDHERIAEVAAEPAKAAADRLVARTAPPGDP